MTLAIYPGSFDPITLGHLDLIRRSRPICDRLLVAVGQNSAKAPLFTVEERLELIRAVTRGEGLDVEVMAFSGLVTELARAQGATWLVRGIRGGADLEQEAAMAQTNRCLNPEVDTLFLLPSPAYSFVSSRLVREIAGLGGDLRSLVPRLVIEALDRRSKPRPAN